MLGSWQRWRSLAETWSQGDLDHHDGHGVDHDHDLAGDDDYDDHPDGHDYHDHDLDGDDDHDHDRAGDDDHDDYHDGDNDHDDYHGGDDDLDMIVLVMMTMMIIMMVTMLMIISIIRMKSNSSDCAKSFDLKCWQLWPKINQNLNLAKYTHNIRSQHVLTFMKIYFDMIKLLIFCTIFALCFRIIWQLWPKINQYSHKSDQNLAQNAHAVPTGR